MSINTNNTTKVLITSSMVFSLIIGFTSMTLAYGFPLLEMPQDRWDRLFGIQGDRWLFKCPNNDTEYGIWMNHPNMSEEYFIKYENLACGNEDTD